MAFATSANRWTFSELTVAYEDKPTVVLEGTGGWSDHIRDIAYK
jgi:hypothetical protein